jgi:hypothetical protein
MPPDDATRPSSHEPHLTEAELAARWRISLRTMQRWRRNGFAPPHLTLGRFTIYTILAVLAFEARHLRDGGAE